MMKHILLASAVMIATPALAQAQQATGSGSTPTQQNSPGRSTMTPESTPPAADSATAPAQTAPAQTAQASPAQADPAAGDPAQPGSTGTASAQTGAQPAPAQGGTASAATDPAATPAQPVNKADQVAQVVNAEFPSYDKDSNGALSNTEFGAWMVALRTASDPAAKAEDPAVKTWVTQAFAQADKDKSKTVSKAELEGFLSQAG